MNIQRFRNWLGALPVHILIILLTVIWIVPTLGLLVTSFRPVQDANETGWWTVFSALPGNDEYQQFCASCHGPTGRRYSCRQPE